MVWGVTWKGVKSSQLKPERRHKVNLADWSSLQVMFLDSPISELPSSVHILYVGRLVVCQMSVLRWRDWLLVCIQSITQSPLFVSSFLSQPVPPIQSPNVTLTSMISLTWLCGYYRRQSTVGYQRTGRIMQRLWRFHRFVRLTSRANNFQHHLHPPSTITTVLRSSGYVMSSMRWCLIFCSFC